MALADYVYCTIEDVGVACWGWSGAILGQGTGPDDDVCLAEPVAIDLGTTKKVVSIAVGGVAIGDAHGCALFEDGSVKCWGTNDKGQLGLDDTLTRGDEPGELGKALPFVELGEPAVAIAANGGTSCAILSSGSAKCWGERLGEENESDGDAPGDMAALTPLTFGPEGTKVVDMAAGGFATCFLLSNGKVNCRGYEYNSVLLPDSTPEKNANLGAARTATGVASAEAAHCAVLDGGRVKCWGENTECETGYSGGSFEVGDDTEEQGDALVELDLGVDFVVASIAGGERHFCALSTDGIVKCWGGNGNEQLGYRSDFGDDEVCAPTTDGVTPPAWALTGKVIEIAAGGFGTCARFEDGTYECTMTPLGC
jgi:alpha-tubulin suppressor-like RCC1 family protein